MTNTTTTAATNTTVSELLPTDILCGKDKTYGKHPGNQVYRRLIEERAVLYANSGMSKQVKMGVTKEIVAQLETAGARFLRKTTGQQFHDNNTWEEISNQEARDKTSHALRFCAKYHGTQKKRLLLLPAVAASLSSSTSSSMTSNSRPKHVRGSSSTTGSTTTTGTAATGTTATNKAATVSPSRRHHRRMVSSEESTCPIMEQSNAIAIFQRQQAILHQSLHNMSHRHHYTQQPQPQPPLYHHHQHQHHHQQQQYRRSSSSKAIWAEDNDDEVLPPPHHHHRHAEEEEEDIQPDGVVSSSRDLTNILQEPLHESISEDGDWGGFFIHPSASSSSS
jgi:hypothetical protein